jgi:demethylmenaquinone methyltransferase/2-methoxy-6-polyprenyl-1,4-benzoquinol methylase
VIACRPRPRRAASSTCRLNAEKPCRFPTASFDCVTIAFGLRNVTDKAAALREMRRVLRPAASLMVLEFSQPWRRC